MPAINELTTVSATGTGVFDQLMQATKLHLEQEYRAGRIKGSEYAQVYLGALTAVMQQAVSFLQVQQQDDLLQAQLEKLAAEKALVEAQQAKLAADTALVEAQIAKVEAEMPKLDAEIAVLQQRALNEEAQRKDIVDGLPVAGVIGKQKELHQAQIDGFTRDAEQKLAKLMVDVWSVQRTTDEGISPAGAGIADAEIKKVVDKAKQGIGVTPS
jgi:septal ring factor EnvC (AmiA/AmiB activator)